MSWESKDESELQPTFEDSLSGERNIDSGHCFSEEKRGNKNFISQQGRTNNVYVQRLKLRKIKRNYEPQEIKCFII